MRIFGRNVIHGSDSPENGKREIGNITLGSTVILHSGHNSSSNISLFCFCVFLATFRVFSLNCY